MEAQVRVYLCTPLLTSFEPFHFLPLSKAVQGILSPLISLKPIVLSLAQCLQFIPPYFECPYGCPLLQPNFFIVICTFCYHFLTFIQISFYTIQLNYFFKNASDLHVAKSNDNIISHHLSSYPFFVGWISSQDVLFSVPFTGSSSSTRPTNIVVTYLYVKHFQYYIRGFHLNSRLINTNVHIEFT